MAIVKRYRRRRITTVNIKILIFQIVKRRLRQSILKFEFFSTVSSAIMFLKKGGYIFLTRNSGFLYDNSSPWLRNGTTVCFKKIIFYIFPSFVFSHLRRTWIVIAECHYQPVHLQTEVGRTGRVGGPESVGATAASSSSSSSRDNMCV